MVKVECDGCRAPYQIDEKRIPPAGLKMRCPKCGTNLLVKQPGADLSDLPALVPPDQRKTAPRRPAHSDPQLPAALGGGTRPAFGELDLMLDLPGPPSAPLAPAPGLELFDADLPALRAPDEDLPSVREGGADLPSIRQSPSKHRGRTVPFGELDLSAKPPDEPFEIDLPSVPRRRPEPQDFGEIDLPLVSGRDALPMAAQTSGLPAHAPDGAMPLPAQSSGLPAHAPTGLLPEAQTPQPKSPDAFGEELSLGPSSGVVSSSRGAFDDFDRAIPMQGGGALGPDLRGAIPLAIEEEEEQRPVGDEVDLAAAPSDPGEAKVPPRAQAPRAPLFQAGSQASPGPPAGEALRPKRSTTRRLAVVAIVLVAVGGAALSLEPSIGPFGVNFIGDQVNAKKHAAALVDLRAAAAADLDEDTAPAAARALARAQGAQANAPRYQPTAAYHAYLALSRSLRFGHRSDDLALAGQLLANQRPGSVALELATAAADAERGQLEKARQATAALLARAPDDPDAAALAGEIELAAKSPDKALAAWREAVSRRGAKKSARALFGLARAEVLAGNAAGAAASARAAIEASPQHIGARILLASQLWQNPDQEADALGELQKVTDDQALRISASDAELVAAFTVRGRIHLARSRISAAEQAFAVALKLDPQAVDALVGSGELFYQSRRYSEASARFEAAMRADDSRVAAKVGSAKTWLAQERMKEAKDLLKKVQKAHAKDPAVNFWLGRVEEALGNKKEAEAAYGEAIKANDASPEVVEAYVATARLLGGIGRADDANQKLFEASQRFPGLAALYRAKGELLLQTGRYEAAKDEFTAALEKGDDIATRFKLGVALRRMRSFEEAARVFDNVAGVDKDFPGLTLERGLLFQETGQSDRALEMYSDALRKAPNDVDLKLHVGSTQVMAGHAAQAEATLREVVTARPTSAEANHFLGRALLVKGSNLPEAMRFLEAAVSIDSNRAEYFLYVGWGANETGQPARAETALKRALELDRELGDAYWQLGVWYQTQRATLDALQNLKTAIEKRPSRFEAYATMALCYQDLQRWPEAEDAYRKAIAGNGAVGEWHYRLGKLYASHGKQAGAGPELELAVKLSDVPDRPAPGWLFDAHFLLAEALRGKNREQAILHYQRFLKLAPAGNAYIDEAQKALRALHAAPLP